jgi:hypothetical protein
MNGFGRSSWANMTGPINPHERGSKNKDNVGRSRGVGRTRPV